MLVAFAASVAGVCHAHEPRGKLVAEVALEDAVFDQHGFLGRRALIVDIQGSAARRHGAVVDHGHLGAGDLLSDKAREGRGLLAIEVGFEPVAHGFMQQNAGPARAENHFHVARRRGNSIQLQDGLAGRFPGEVLGRLVALKEADLHPAAAAGAAARVLRSVAGDDVTVQAGQRLRVVGEGAIGGRDENVAQLVVVAGAHLHDARVIGPRGAVRAHHQFQLGGDPRIGIGGGDGVEACFGRLAEAGHLLFRGPVGDQGRGARGTHQPFGGKIIGIGIAGAIPGDRREYRIPRSLPGWRI